MFIYRPLLLNYSKGIDSIESKFDLHILQIFYINFTVHKISSYGTWYNLTKNYHISAYINTCKRVPSGYIYQFRYRSKDFLFEIYLEVDLNYFTPEIGLRPQGHHGLISF